MPTIRAGLVIEVDGVPLAGSPFMRTVHVDEAFPINSVDKAATADATYSQLSPSLLDTLQFLFLATDKAVKVRLDGQSDAGIELGANGLLLAINATIDASASTNVTVNNSAAVDVDNDAKLSGVFAGT